MNTPEFARLRAQILYGNLAPEGSVAKITGKEGLQFRGPARVFDSEEAMLDVVGQDPQQLKVRCAVACRAAAQPLHACDQSPPVHPFPLEPSSRM